MDGQRFDAVAKAVGSGATRRAALRRLGGGLAGGALAALGLGRAVHLRLPRAVHLDLRADF